jgi:aryl-alcohol dehydrogenase-like predicted oxidoreductase
MLESDRGRERQRRVAGLVPIAQDLGTNLSNLSIAWCLLNKNVSTVILGASKVEQLTENLEATEVVPLLNEAIQARLAEI